MVVSYDFWQVRYGGSSDVFGKTLKLNGHPYTIVGVTPRASSARWWEHPSTFGCRSVRH